MAGPEFSIPTSMTEGAGTPPPEQDEHEQMMNELLDFESRQESPKLSVTEGSQSTGMFRPLLGEHVDEQLHVLHSVSSQMHELLHLSRSLSAQYQASGITNLKQEIQALVTQQQEETRAMIEELKGLLFQGLRRPGGLQGAETFGGERASSSAVSWAGSQPSSANGSLTCTIEMGQLPVLLSEEERGIASPLRGTRNLPLRHPSVIPGQLAQIIGNAMSLAQDPLISEEGGGMVSPRQSDQVLPFTRRGSDGQAIARPSSRSGRARPGAPNGSEEKPKEKRRKRRINATAAPQKINQLHSHPAPMELINLEQLLTKKLLKAAALDADSGSDNELPVARRRSGSVKDGAAKEGGASSSQFMSAPALPGSVGDSDLLEAPPGAAGAAAGLLIPSRSSESIPGPPGRPPTEEAPQEIREALPSPVEEDERPPSRVSFQQAAGTQQAAASDSQAAPRSNLRLVPRVLPATGRADSALSMGSIEEGGGDGSPNAPQGGLRPALRMPQPQGRANSAQSMEGDRQVRWASRGSVYHAQPQLRRNMSVLPADEIRMRTNLELARDVVSSEFASDPRYNNITPQPGQTQEELDPDADSVVGDEAAAAPEQQPKTSPEKAVEMLRQASLVACRYGIPALIRVSGLAPWNRKARIVSTFYSWCVMLVLLASLAKFVLQSARANVDHLGVVGNCGLLSDMLLALGACSTLVATGALTGNWTLAKWTRTIEKYSENNGFNARWLQLTSKEAVLLFLLWLGAVALRVLSMQLIDPDQEHLVISWQQYTNFAAFVLCTLQLTVAILVVLQLSLGLSGLADHFTSNLAIELDCPEAERHWNVVQAVDRTMCSAMQYLVFALGATAFGCSMLGAVDIVLHGFDLLWLLCPALCIMMAVARVFMAFASFTEQCVRLPSLVVALDFGKDLDMDKMFVAKLIDLSQAGFYVFDVRLTMALLLRCFYLTGGITLYIASRKFF